MAEKKQVYSQTKTSYPDSSFFSANHVTFINPYSNGI